MSGALQYCFPKTSVVASATRLLAEVLQIPKQEINEDASVFGVSVNGTVFHGVLPLLHVLRDNAHTDAAREFLGAASFRQSCVVNQWVSAAAWLCADAALHAQGSQAAVLYSRVEQMIESQNLSQSYLGLTSEPGVADILLYAALHNHPQHTAVRSALPATRRWSAFVEVHPLFQPIRVEHGASAEVANSAKAKVKPVYVKPSEEAILQRRLEKERAKKEKEAQKAGSSSNAKTTAVAAKSPLSLNDQVDIRVARMSNLRRHPEADRLYIEDMDIGTETRTVVSGLVEHYTVDQLENSLCFVFCNMKPRPLKGVVSQGMVLCASDESKVVLARPPTGAKPGDRVVFGSAYVAPSNAPPPPPSGNKMTELLQHFHTDEEGVVCWKDDKAWLQQGCIVVPDMANCVVK